MQKYSTAGRDDALPSTKAKKFVRDVSAQGKTKTTATSIVKDGIRAARQGRDRKMGCRGRHEMQLKSAISFTRSKK